ncbi:MAG: DedA family protein [Candidatus Zixiibacteriota bacterium]
MSADGTVPWLTFLTAQSLWWAFGVFFIAAFTEMWFPPFPGDAVFFLGLVMLETGGRPVYGALVASSLGGFVGFALLYWLGVAKGRLAFRKRSTGLFSHSALTRVEAWFQRWGGLVIVFGRFLVGVRSVVPLAAGVGGYPRRRALALGGVSILIWNGLLATLALVLHENWESVAGQWRTVSIGFWILVGLTVLFAAVRYFRRRSSRRSES